MPTAHELIHIDARTRIFTTHFHDTKYPLHFTFHHLKLISPSLYRLFHTRDKIRTTNHTNHHQHSEQYKHIPQSYPPALKNQKHIFLCVCFTVLLVTFPAFPWSPLPDHVHPPFSPHHPPPFNKNHGGEL